MNNNKQFITCTECHTSFDKKLLDAHNDEVACIYCEAIISSNEQSDERVIKAKKSKYIKKKPSKLKFLGNLSLVLAILGCLAVSGAYQFRDSLAEDQRFRPYVKTLCEKLDCSLKKFQDVSKIMIHNPKVLADTQNNLAMTLSANMENQAKHAQQYPDLQLNFLNDKGEILYKQVYKPRQYLKNSNHKQVLFREQNTDIEIKFIAQSNSEATDLSLVILGEEQARKPSLG